MTLLHFFAKMHHNICMYENARMFFVFLLYASFSCLCGLALYNLVTWGGQLDYLLAAGIVVAIALFGLLVTSI